MPEAVKAIPSRIKTAWASYTSRQRISITMGVGLVLFTAHNIDQPGLNLIYLPAIGTLLLIFATWFAYLRGHWTMGPKRIWIPLAIISASIVVAGAMEWNYHGVGTALMGVVLFSVYLASRWLGQDIFKVFTVAVLVECAIIIYQGLAHPGLRTGGVYGGAAGADFGNYAMALRLLVFGFLASTHIRPSRRWLLLIVVVIALFFTGAEETLLIGIIMGIVVLVRRDIGRRLVAVSVGVLLVLVATLPFGIPQDLYSKFTARVDAVETGTYEGLNFASGRRLETYKTVIENIRPFGHGYYVTEFGGDVKRVPHNVPLVIVEQVGPLAAVAWLWVTGFMVVKTRWKYLFIGILAMSILDHAFWTQASPWWWVAVGVASAHQPQGNTDRIFNAND